MPDGGTRATAPALGHRRYVVVSRHKGAAVVFGYPTTLERAYAEAEKITDRAVGVYELRLVRP